MLGRAATPDGKRAAVRGVGTRMSSERAWAARTALVALLPACSAHETPKTVTLRESEAAPTEIAAVALPQTHAAPSPRRARWTPPPPKSPPDRAEARLHFVDGVRAWSASDYALALSEFETAYAYSAHPAVLYNIAMALERVGREAEALDVFERYAASPDARRADEVRQRIAELRRRHLRP